MSSQLVVHNPKFDAKLCGIDALRALPFPAALGRMHKPIPHIALIETLQAEVEARGWLIKREQLALGREGAALFGVMDLVLPNSDLVVVEGQGISFGFRNSTDSSLGLQGVAGSRVFVCDNLALSGSMFAIKRKNTTGLDLGAAIAWAFDKFLKHARNLGINIARLAETTLDDAAAKLRIYDVFAKHIIPIRLFDDVNRFYFKADENTPDCQPRTAWGLHNAFTRAMKDLSPIRGFGANVALGNQFALDTIDGEVVSVE
jgi:uncharacterized protein DUF932